MALHHRLLALHLALLLLAGTPLTAQSQPRVGLTELAGLRGDGPIQVFHPSDTEPATVRRGVFTIRVADGGSIAPGNGRLIVISHGSGPHPMVQAEHDRWLIPRFHSTALMAHCTRCDLLASLPRGGHGALLAPLPPRADGLIGRLIADPPGFDRDELPALYQRIEAFFRQQLLP